MKVATLFAFFFYCVQLLSQDLGDDEGKYATRIFTPKEYRAGNEVLSFVQDQQNILYIGNSNGVLIYNGANWETVSLPNRSEVLWVSIDKNNVVFVAGNEEFGYLTKEDGQYNYQSLASSLPKKTQGFGSIWEVESTSYGTYFRTSNYLFWYHEGELDILSKEDFSGGGFDVIYSVNDTLHLRKVGVGLGRIIGDQFELLPGGEFFSSIKTNAISQFQDQILVSTRIEGLFLLDDKGVSEFENEIQEDLKEYRIYHATTHDNVIAIATLTKGVFILDENGTLIEHINESRYGVNENANYVFYDSQNALWIGTLNGMARVDFEDKFRLFGLAGGKNIVINEMEKIDGVYYFATSVGIFYAPNTNFETAKKVEGINNPCTFIAKIDDIIFFEGNAGIYSLSPDFKAKIENRRSAILYQLSSDTLYLIGGQEGLVTATHSSINGFKEISTLDVGNNIAHILEVNPNEVWLCPEYNGLSYFDLETDSVAHFNHFGNSKVIVINSEPVFITSIGTFELNESRFEKSKFFYHYIDSLSFTISDIQTDGQENILITYQDTDLAVHFLWLEKGVNDTYGKHPLPDLGLTQSDFSSSYLEQNGIIWLTTSEEILRLDARNSVNNQLSFVTSITSMAAKGELLNRRENEEVTVSFSQNRISFTYAAVHFNSYGTNKYQYRLVGFDDEWSDWSNETRAEYTYLPEGNYQFEVKAKNPSNAHSGIDFTSFSILSPWYRTYWAISVYLALAVVLIIALIRIRSARLLAENKKLEKVVGERTQEVAKKNQKLEEQNQLKSNFFANISHELRTPLTLINGQLEALEKDSNSNVRDQRIENSKRNVAQLGNMIEDLLDLSKLELAKKFIDPKPTSINRITNRIVGSFESLAESKNIQLSYRDDTEIPAAVLLDVRQFEKVINNLLYNAFKFTPAEGIVSVTIYSKASSFLIEISDTGGGINAADLPHIFDRFYQAKNQNSSEAGSGLGLAISKEIIELHDGTIDVKSVENTGTTFIISLPTISDGLAQDHGVEVSTIHKLDIVEEVESEVSFEQFLSKSMFNGIIDKPLILMVEDNEEMRDYLEEILESNFNVSKVSNGEEALEWLKTGRPQLIISDVMMPLMDGFELLAALKNSLSHQNIPVILLTARSSQEDRLVGLRFGVDDYITKPFDRDELLVRAINLVSNLHARMALAKELEDSDGESSQELISLEDEKLVKTAESYMESRISDSSLSVREVASSVAMSERQFYRKISKITGMTPANFMKEIRLQYAHKLLIGGKIVKLSQISSEVGMSSAYYFSKLFYERFGKRPSKYIER